MLMLRLVQLSRLSFRMTVLNMTRFQTITEMSERCGHTSEQFNPHKL